MTIYEEVVKFTIRMTHAEKVLLLEHLSHAIKQHNEMNDVK